MEQLPYEIIELIIHYLSVDDIIKLSDVNKMMQSITSSYYVHDQILIYDPKITTKLMNKCPFLTNISLENYTTSKLDKNVEILLTKQQTLKNPTIHTIHIEYNEINDYMTDIIVEKLVSVLKFSLKSIDLSGCCYITDLTTKYLSTCPNIKSINLSKCRFMEDCTTTYLNECNNLESIYLSDCYELTDSAIEFLALNPNIRTIELVSCNKLTSIIAQFLSNHKNILSINLQECNNMTDDAVKFLTMCPRLQYINLSKCKKLTDNVAKYLAMSTSIKHIILSGCYELTYISVKYLSNGCIKHILEVLDLSYCYQMRNDSIEFLTKFPNLKFVNLQTSNVTKEHTKKILKDRWNIVHGFSW